MGYPEFVSVTGPWAGGKMELVSRATYDAAQREIGELRDRLVARDADCKAAEAARDRALDVGDKARAKRDEAMAKLSAVTVERNALRDLDQLGKQLDDETKQLYEANTDRDHYKREIDRLLGVLSTVRMEQEVTRNEVKRWRESSEKNDARAIKAEDEAERYKYSFPIRMTMGDASGSERTITDLRAQLDAAVRETESADRNAKEFEAARDVQADRARKAEATITGLRADLVGANARIRDALADAAKWKTNFGRTLQWRDHTAAVLDNLLNAVNCCAMQNPTLHLTEARDRAAEVLKVDPEKTYGIVDPNTAVWNVKQEWHGGTRVRVEFDLHEGQPIPPRFDVMRPGKC
jgi:chromosome segregation ATPase